MAKILVFTSYGGGGHISASQALKECLGEQHEVTIVPFFIDVLDKMDPVKLVTFKKYHVEDIYNYCLRRKWAKTLNAIYYISQYCMPILEPMIIKHLLRFIAREGKPDLIISVIPLVNHSILKVAEKFQIPFLVIPTDLDSTTFLFGFNKPSYPKFKLSLPYEDKAIANKTTKAAIASKQLVVSGFPIRSSFLQVKDKIKLKKEFQIQPNIPVLLLMMGAEGSSATLLYIKELLKLKMPIHIFLILGRNNSISKQIQKFSWPPHISYTMIGFTDRISDLMAIADLCITKSGSVSVSECIYMQLPVLLDGTSTPLLWEQFNLDFIKENKLGDVINSTKDITRLINYYLSNETALNQIYKQLQSFAPPRFCNNISMLVAELIS